MVSRPTTTQLTVEGVDVEVTFKRIKHMHIRIKPPSGEVRVSAPLRMREDEIRRVLRERIDWIAGHRERIRSTPPLSPQQLVTGELHPVWGELLELEVIERAGRAIVGLQANRLVMTVAPQSTLERRSTLLNNWYRDELKSELPMLIAKWESVLDVRVPSWSMRRMRSRWGTCNIQTRHILFNTELAKYPPDCVEYVVVHEMAHYFETGHGPKFSALMDKFLPDWRARKKQLNATGMTDD